MSSLWEVLVLGLLLGVRHAFDADHLVAVTTIVSEYKNPFRAIWIGVSWGLGHTTTLLLVGLVLLGLGLSIPDSLALFFEFLVGIVLVLLGLQTFWNLRRRRLHSHVHQHGQESHPHFHVHGGQETHAHIHPRVRWNNFTQLLIAGVSSGDHHNGSAQKAVKPAFRLKSYIVGTVHGLAGSAALMLLVLASLKSVWSGAAYLLIFGLGSVLSMGIVSIIISLPFLISSRLPRLNGAIQVAAGLFSIAFGVMLMYEVGIVDGLLPFG